MPNQFNYIPLSDFLIQQLHPSKNGDLDAAKIGAGSSKKLWWKCINDASHEWQAQPCARTRGQGCPYCAGKKTDKNNSLATLFPDLAKEWHPLNDKTPNDVGKGSRYKAWWICPRNAHHDYQAKVSHRTGKMSSGCPFCVGKKVNHTNSFAAMNPELAKEWHKTLNGLLTPHDITECSGKKVWWQCPRFEHHVYRAYVNNRYNGQNCSICKESKGERAIDNHLRSLGFHYVRQFKIRTCKHVKNLPYDFAVCPDGMMPLLLEFQGIQHFSPVKLFGGNDLFIKLKIRDEIKRKWAEDHDIPYLEIPFFRVDDIPQLIDEAIGKLPKQRSLRN
ncbi:zinc-ribbon domain-containing protein [Tundrisphaera sp. TA3]|uniref:zinc-ribbon domain-containing protein n=1 Tax=Tundrisphaera sp. TA3 TaxID=3435775 RepID=UPI003EBCDE3F